jgi:hypothetical protein
MKQIETRINITQQKKLKKVKLKKKLKSFRFCILFFFSNLSV